MSVRVLLLFLTVFFPLRPFAVEMKVGQSLSGSMPKITLTNSTIFPQEASIEVYGASADSFVLDAHASTDVYVECHAVAQPEKIPFGVKTSTESWTQEIPSARAVHHTTAIWISSQRQGRAHLESLLRAGSPNLKLRHLTLAQSPLNLAEYDGLSMVLLSAGDLERLSDGAFQTLKRAVGLGMPLVISAREKNDSRVEHLSRLTALRFGVWSPVTTEMNVMLPAATRIAAIAGQRPDARLDSQIPGIVNESPFGFGWVRLVAVPFANMRPGTLSEWTFAQPDSRLNHPSRWLESRTSRPVDPLFVSWVVPLSGAILFLLVLVVRRRRRLVMGTVALWWIWMLMEPVADKGVLLSEQWGVVTELDTGGVVLARMDIDHRLGGPQVLDITNEELDFRSLRAGAACFVHRDGESRIVLPPSVERMTRLVVGYTHGNDVVVQQGLTGKVLPSWPKEQFAGARLEAISPPKFHELCVGTHCSFYRLQP